MARIPNVSKLGHKELDALIAKVNKQKDRLDAKARAKGQKTWEAVNAVLKKHGMTLDEVMKFEPAKPRKARKKKAKRVVSKAALKPAKKKAKKKVAKVTPKYVNPDNPKETWAGRGRKAKWVELALAGGKSLDDLLIK